MKGDIRLQRAVNGSFDGFEHFQMVGNVVDNNEANAMLFLPVFFTSHGDMRFTNSPAATRSSCAHLTSEAEATLAVERNAKSHTMIVNIA